VAGVERIEDFFKIFSSLLFLSEQQIPPRTSYDILLSISKEPKKKYR
jgi:hypothetical protein